MSPAELLERFWPAIAIIAVVGSLSVFCLFYALRRPVVTSSATWTTEERDRVRILKIGTSVAVVLCWIGAFIVVAGSPIMANGAINCSWFKEDTNLWAMAILAVIVIGLPILATSFWIQLLRHSWSGTEVPDVSTYLLNYSLWLGVIWSKILIGW